MEFMSPGLTWLLVGIILFLLEMAVPGLVLFFFGVAAWITALGSYLFAWNLNTQLAVFLISSLLSLLLLRKYLKKIFIGDSKNNDQDNMQAQGGEKCMVTKSILPPAEGQVKFGGTFWRADADEQIPEGETVVIIQQQGLLLKVKKIQ